MAERTTVIVQARYGSTRLPGKVLEKVAGHTVLEHVLHRCKAIRGASSVCCAIPVGTDSDAVAAEARRAGVMVYRGDEHDVLGRYYGAAREIGTDVVMRVTSDCPLIDPQTCDEVLRERAKRKADYASNNMPRVGPHGLDCEAFTFAALEQADREAKDAHSREHVTPWLRTHAELARINVPAPSQGAGMRWTLDYPEDLAFFRALFAVLPPWPAIPSAGDVMAIVAQHPEIARINEHLRAPAAA